MSVGGPQHLMLDLFGSVVASAFGEYPFQVGSSVESKQWRDVDVVVMLWPDVYADLGMGDMERRHAMNLAFSALGKQMTGLPIDFKVQHMIKANEQHKGFRNSLGHLLVTREDQPEGRGGGE